MVRLHRRFFVFAALAGLALRLLFLFRFPSITADSLIYGDIAKNWLQHGIFGSTELGKVVPTYIRLPGYPAFLAAVFFVFGMDHYRAVLVLQILLDLGSCFLIADMARRIVSPPAAKAAFLLAALCPFLANYAAAALTETMEIFFTVLALEFALIGMERIPLHDQRAWIVCGAAVSAAILLRPDGGLLLLALALYFPMRFFGSHSREPYAGMARHVLSAGLVVAFVSLAPLVPWTVRNLRTFHEFQPLAPRYANEKGEFVPMGFNRWTKTWMGEYVSVEEVYWPVPDDLIDVEKLPTRAFDSAQQQNRTRQLLADYNQVLHMTPALDARFEALAEERIRAAPLRYYLWLPLARVADMWLRPRTELLPADTRWWEFNDDPKWSIVTVALGIIGVLYVAGALAALVQTKFWGPKLNGPMALLFIFLVLRSVFLGSLENPEPRYTLECYPVVIVLAAALFQRHGQQRMDRGPVGEARQG